MTKNTKQTQSEKILYDADLVKLHAAIAFADMRNYVEFANGTIRLKDLTNADMRPVQELTVGAGGEFTIRLKDKHESLDFLWEWLHREEY